MLTRKLCMRLTVAVALAVIGVVAFAPASAAGAAPNDSPFEGSWSGTWSIAGLDIHGTFDWSISSAGRIQGTVANITAGVSGAMVGHVGGDGKIMIVGFVPGDGFHGIPFQGAAEIDDDGRLVVSVSRTDTDRSLVAILEAN